MFLAFGFIGRPFIINFFTLKLLPQIDQRVLNWIVALHGALIVGMSTLAALQANVVVVSQREERINGIDD